MIFSRIAFVGLAVAGLAAGVVFASGHGGPGDAAIKARKAHMQLNAFNLGVLGAMAKGDMEYDADRASAAARNLAALSQLSHAGYWLPGTDSGSIEGTRAKAALWEPDSEAGDIGMKLAEAAAAMAAAAGTGVEGIRENIGAVGGACGACHKAYREPDS